MTTRFKSSVAAALLMLVTSCGSDEKTTSPIAKQTAPPAAETPSDPPIVTTAPPITTTTTTTTATATTTATTTTADATTAAPTSPATSVPEVAHAGWTETSRDFVSGKAFPPCCADTWHGDISPALAPASLPLADGPYAVTMHWPEDLAQPLELEIHRFERCSLLPEFSCESGPDYTVDELGVDVSASRLLTLALDGSVSVVLVGWDESTAERVVIEQATGTELVELAQAVDRAYAEVFGDRFVDGEAPDAIVADVMANPTGGFGPALDSFGSFVFSPDSGAPLLFQVIFPFADDRRVAGRGTDVLAIRSIEVVDGQFMLFVYAAFVP